LAAVGEGRLGTDNGRDGAGVGQAGAALLGDSSGVAAGAAFLFARGAGLDKAGVRVGDWQAELGKIREFLGPATRKTSL
jgi:hypothetical protein